jgi:signal transduction histidine kinase/CheY-like chemotaxis protein
VATDPVRRAGAGHRGDRLRGSLLRRYVLTLGGLLCGALLISACVNLAFSYRETRLLVDELQREKARSAAARIEQFLQNIEIQARTALSPGQALTGPAPDRRQIDLLRLIRSLPAVSDASWIDSTGMERARVSRIGRDLADAPVNRTADPGFLAARSGKTWFGPVEFRRDTEPHVVVMVPAARRDDGVITAAINLKFAFDVVSDIRIGRHGIAYVVDARGQLIAHPDASLVLRRTNLSGQPAVREALSRAPLDPAQAATFSRDARGALVLAADARVAATDWRVMVEQPADEAFASLYALLLRTVIVLALGIATAILVSRYLAGRMVAPIRTLEAGVRRFGDGHLEEKVEVRSDDELEALAEQFNAMAERLRNSYADLERRIDERTLELAAANRAKSRFLAAASHDLRQPVHALGLFVAQLEEATSESARRALVARVAASSAAVSELIDALLDISRLDAGIVATRKEAFPLQHLLDRIEQALAPSARERGLRLRVRSTSLWVHSDPFLLERILFNLCGNAVRYTRRGGAIVTARKRDGMVRIEVRDTGIGIAPADLPHVFEEFFQAPQSRATEGRGLGLGLAIVDRLARLLELKVQVRSVVDRGTTFRVDLPPAEGIEPLADRPDGTRQLSRFDGMKVLLIDDDTRAREATAGLLSGWGCTVLAAAGNRDAWRLLGDAGPRVDLVICDYHLADGLDGVAVVAALRTAAGRDTAAVIISADTGGDLRAVAAAAGLPLLHKPLKAARLRAFLQLIAYGAPPPS